MRLLKSIFLCLLAIILFLVLCIPTFVYGLFRYKNKAQYFYNIAIGIDQLGGSLFYNQPDWTISAWTYYMSTKDKRYTYLRKVIDFFFGKDHCQKAFEGELKTTERILSQIKGVSHV